MAASGSIPVTITPAAGFADAKRLLARIDRAASCGERLTFLFGSALTASGSKPQDKGVPDANGMVSRVVDSFKATPEFEALEKELSAVSGSDRYQVAMKFLLDCRGQDEVNQLVRDAVLEARLAADPDKADEQVLENHLEGWHLRPAVASAGKIISDFGQFIGNSILTSNFDPLLEIAIRRAGGAVNSVFLTADGRFDNILSEPAKNVVHFHGFWRGGDTLHTPVQLMRHRPQLKGCLRDLLRRSTLCVIGYGGWSDIFTRTLVEVINEESEAFNVLWTFYSDNEEAILNNYGSLVKAFDALVAQRIVFYKGVDCHVFLPLLHARLAERKNLRPSPAAPIQDISESDGSASDASDLPPRATTWVGREEELNVLLGQGFKIIGITGIGGQGKSTLAAKYLELVEAAGGLDFWHWSDCREESNTLHTHVVRIIERASKGVVHASSISEQDTNSVVRLLFKTLEGRGRCVLFFDNVDHYVDVEQSQGTLAMQVLIDYALRTINQVQLVFTCRPRLLYTDAAFLALELSGLTIPETQKLFEIKGAQINVGKASSLISEVHSLTSGHPMWLNLIATQVSRNKIDLEQLISKIKGGHHADLPTSMLMEIWQTLNPKQQTLLRFLAEAVRPEQIEQVGEFLAGTLNYNQFSKAVRVLRALDLLVFKSPINAPETVELHPLVREFIRRQFAKPERTKYISRIVTVLDRFIQKFRQLLTGDAPYNVLALWIQKVELLVNSGKLGEAAKVLTEVGASLQRKGFDEEYARLAINIFSELDWSPATPNEIENFDQIFLRLIHILSQSGEYQSADRFLGKYQATLTGKTARYVCFCDCQSYSLWCRGHFDEAQSWGRRGVELKAQGRIDTHFDCAHNLALALRDGGKVDEALPHFLRGSSLDSICGAEIDKTRGGAFYGNIGRCLHYKGDFDRALILLRKSAQVLEFDNEEHVFINRGWAAFWIGEILEKKNELRHAHVCYSRAARIWEKVSPPRHEQAEHAADRLRIQHQFKILDEAAEEREYFAILRVG